MNAPEYKPVFIGDEQLPEKLGKSLLESNFVGIEVATDSTVLHEQLLLAGATSRDTETSILVKALARFSFVTEQNLTFAKPDGSPMKRLEQDYPGDLYMSPDMNNFYFWGINKLGTLMSMAYGIRALHTIEDGKLGLHSSLIYDHETEAGTLLVGKNRSGKSTLGQAVEDSNRRYTLLSDDWNEVNIDNGLASPISQVFSLNHPSKRYELAFKSFGKSFYRKPGNNTAQAVPINHIIEIRDEIENEKRYLFIARSLAHVPLIMQPLDELEAQPGNNVTTAHRHKIAGRIGAILAGYDELCGRVPMSVVHNDRNTNTIDDAVQRVLEVVED